MRNQYIVYPVTRKQLTGITQLLRYNLCEEAGEFYSLTLLNHYTRIPNVNREPRKEDL